jgi:FKBP-type peptidyl-prolyl cis-trans isomerase 2
MMVHTWLVPGRACRALHGPADPRLPPPQVVVNYVAMTEDKKSGALRVFDSSLEKGKPYDIRCARASAGSGSRRAPTPEPATLKACDEASGWRGSWPAVRVLPSRRRQRLRGARRPRPLPTPPVRRRVGAGQVVPGLDEGLLTMQPGGIRRLYVPGALAFPKNLKAAPGRPAILAFTPVVFDVQLLYIPGMETDEE